MGHFGKVITPTIGNQEMWYGDNTDHRGILRQNFSRSADFQGLLSNESSKDYSKINRKKDQFLFVKRTEITFMCGAVRIAIDIKKIANNRSKLPLKIINKIAIIKKEKPLVNHDFR